jgi:hypothetical protein
VTDDHRHGQHGDQHGGRRDGGHQSAAPRVDDTVLGHDLLE